MIHPQFPRLTENSPCHTVGKGCSIGHLLIRSFSAAHRFLQRPFENGGDVSGRPLVCQLKKVDSASDSDLSRAGHATMGTEDSLNRLIEILEISPLATTDAPTCWSLCSHGREESKDSTEEFANGDRGDWTYSAAFSRKYIVFVGNLQLYLADQRAMGVTHLDSSHLRAVRCGAAIGAGFLCSSV